MHALQTNDASTRSGSQFQRELVALLPQLRAYSRALCGRKGIADDMAQEALAKAWKAQARFEMGTNMKAWLFTILRNEFFSHTRRSWRETHWDAEKSEAIPGVPDEQLWAVDLDDTARALHKLPDMQREALILIAAGGFSYEDTAKLCNVAVGTVKSRVSRARATLVTMLDGGTKLPERAPSSARKASDDILMQLSVLASGPGAAQHAA